VLKGASQLGLTWIAGQHRDVEMRLSWSGANAAPGDHSAAFAEGRPDSGQLCGQKGAVDSRRLPPGRVVLDYGQPMKPIDEAWLSQPDVKFP
jgi:hypothetical protein